MTAPMMMNNDHPTEETLAAFVDDRLDAATRRTVTEHVAECGDCRELVLMANDFEVSEAPSNVTHGMFGGRRWIAAAGLAAAAVIAVFVLRPSPLFAPDMRDVMNAANVAAKRPGEGRLARFPYMPSKSVMRGDEEPPDFGGKGQAELLDVASHLDESSDPHVIGVISLFTDFADPVAELKKAYATGKDRDAAAIDYAAALIARGSDYQRALELSEEVLQRTKSPEAAWNRAVALTRLERDKEAIRAWDDYLKLDSTSQWAEEAKRKQHDLREFLAPPPR
jgi:hypothetical protein